MDIRESLKRILESQDVFGQGFYDVFFARHPEAKEYFGEIDMKRQALVLTMAMTVIQQYHESRYSTVEQYLRYLGSRHLRLKIPAELYPKWRDSMLTALASFHGGDWSEELAGEWRDAIETALLPMFEGYEHRTGV